MIVASRLSGLLALAVTLVLVGCSSSPSSDVSPLQKTSYGESAVRVAAGVHGCTHVGAVPLSSADRRLISSKGSCMLDGHLVVFVTYPGAAAQRDTADGYTGSAPKGSYAEGVGYRAAPDLAKTDVRTQKALARAVIKSLGGSVVEFARQGPSRSS